MTDISMALAEVTAHAIDQVLTPAPVTCVCGCPKSAHNGYGWCDNNHNDPLADPPCGCTTFERGIA